MGKVPEGQISLLIELQECETNAAKRRAALDALPARIAEIAEGLKPFETAIAEQKERVLELKKVYRANDADIRANHERVKKREVQLRLVKTNKEYQAILKEIEEIKKIISRLEDETIVFLDQMDAAEKAIAEKERDHAVEAEAAARRTADLETEAGEHRAALEGLLLEREDLARRIDQSLFREYEFAKSRGVGIVAVRDAICSGCNMNIPPQMYNELHRENELRNCPHCRRMIYVRQ